MKLIVFFSFKIRPSNPIGMKVYMLQKKGQCDRFQLQLGDQEKRTHSFRPTCSTLVKLTTLTPTDVHSSLRRNIPLDKDS